MYSQSTHGPGSPFPAKGYVWLGIISATTFFFYLAFGGYYATHYAERLGGPGSFQLKDGAFLSAYASWDTAEEGDAAFYNRLALGILNTGLPRNRTGNVSIYAPVYTYFLAACYAVGGLRLLSVLLPQALLAGLLAWCVGLTAGRLVPDKKVMAMCMGGALILVNPRLAASTGGIVPTLLLLLLFSVALYLSAAAELNSRNVLVVATITLICTLTQSAFFVVAFAVALWLAWQYMRRRKVAWAMACAIVIFGVGTMVALRAAVARMGDSYKRENKILLYESNNPYYESMTPTSLWGRRPGNRWSDWQASAQEQKRYEEYLRRGTLSRIDPGLLWILENPGQYLKLCWIRLYTTLGPFTGQMSPRHRMISAAHWLLVFPAGYYGLWKKRHLALSKLALLVFVVLTAFGSLVIVEWYLRYRMPWELILTVYAAVAYAGLFPAKPQQAPVEYALGPVAQ